MRAVRGGIIFPGVVGAAASGAYGGAVVAGLLALVTGQVFDAGSPWPAGVGVLALMGAVGGWLFARLSWLALRMHRRTLVFTVAGGVSCPLAAALGQLHQVDSIGIGLVMITGCASAIRYVSHRRRRVVRGPTGCYDRAAR